jgi:hypothetical protein
MHRVRTVEDRNVTPASLVGKRPRFEDVLLVRCCRAVIPRDGLEQQQITTAIRSPAPSAPANGMPAGLWVIMPEQPAQLERAPSDAATR